MKYLVNIDCLELDLRPLKGGVLFDDSDFRISSSFKPGDWNGFTKCNEIHFQNQMLGKLYSVPTSRLRYADRSIQVLRLSNESLYRDGTIESQIPKFLKTFSFEATAIKELHIAIDGPGIIKRHGQLFQNKSLSRKRPLKLSNYIDDSTKEISGVTLGSKSSDKMISIYNKTKELEKTKKEYIKIYWRENGLIDSRNDIDRIELRLRRKELQGLEKELGLLNDPNFLASIFRSKTESSLTFVNKKRNKKVEVIDWKDFDIKEIKKEKKVEYYESTQRIKTTLKTLFLENLHMAAEGIATKYNLSDWYISKQARWLKENPH